MAVRDAQLTYGARRVSRRRFRVGGYRALLDPLSQVGASGQRLRPASQPTGETEDQHLREHECLADFAEGDAFRCLPQRSLEALDRLTKAFGAETESLMMDRHDEMSASFIGHVHGLFRSAVRMNPGIPSADRHDRQIDGTGSV